MFDTINELQRMASELDIHMAQLSIAWVLSNPGIKCTLVGSRNINELKLNIKAGELKLSQDIIEKIDEISKPVLLKLGYNPDYYENSEESRIR